MALQCSRKFFGQFCRDFRDAIRVSDVTYDRDLGGWIFPLDPPRRLDWHAIYCNGARPPETEGLPYVHPSCPWCGGELNDD